MTNKRSPSALDALTAAQTVEYYFDRAAEVIDLPDADHNQRKMAPAAQDFLRAHGRHRNAAK